MNFQFLIPVHQDYQSSIKENKHFKLNMSLSISTFYIILFIFNSRRKDTQFLSFNQFCCFYSVNNYGVVLYVEDVHPTFVVRYHMPCLWVDASNIGISAYTVQVGEDGKRKYFMSHGLFVAPCTLFGHVLRQEVGQLAKICSGRRINLKPVSSHVSLNTWTTIHQNTHPHSYDQQCYH